MQILPLTRAHIEKTDRSGLLFWFRFQPLIEEFDLLLIYVRNGIILLKKSLLK
ncbi:hypothetical protein NBRC3255_3182 [Gluconobacter thailandicus NBRC 3255]|nr:hypothetical protein NBRC3255_3182 [Gluconobacter thailandicus NBRC 3255]